MFENSPEYEARLRTPFKPPTITLKEIHDAVPKHLLKKDPVRSSLVIVRDIILCSALFYFGFHIDPAARSGLYGLIPITAAWQVAALKTFLWLQYWFWQGLVFMSFFCIAHELGHHALYDNWYANNISGFILDSFILVPFFAWKSSHNAHHKAVGSLERDENYMPYERSDFKLPPRDRARRTDYSEAFEETPIATLGRMLIMQGFGWWLYLGINAMGNKRLYPQTTSLLSPYSPVFKKEQRLSILISDIAIIAMSSVLYSFAQTYGWTALLAFYFIPYVQCNHWIVMCTFLHHSDPSMPHYRKGEWTYLRGAIGTIDRPIMGWIGRFFFHNVSHDHVAHHLFSHAPFYNQPRITEALRAVLKDDYNFDTTNSFYALYRSFTECVFIEEDDGDIVFYKNAEGVQLRALADGVLQEKKHIEESSPEQTDVEAES